MSSGSQISALDPLIPWLPIATHCPARKNIDTKYASRDTGAPGDFLVTPGDTGKTLKPRSWENGHVHGISMNITNIYRYTYIYIYIKTLSDKTIGFTQLKTKWVYNHQRMEWRRDEPKMGIAHICHMPLYSVVSPYHCWSVDKVIIGIHWIIGFIIILAEFHHALTKKNGFRIVNNRWINYNSWFNSWNGGWFLCHSELIIQIQWIHHHQSAR